MSRFLKWLKPFRPALVAVLFTGLTAAASALTDNRVDQAETVMFRLPASEAAMMARRKETVSGMPRLLPDRPVAVAPPPPPKSRRTAWLLFALLVVIAGAVVVWRMGAPLP